MLYSLFYLFDFCETGFPRTVIYDFIVVLVHKSFKVDVEEGVYLWTEESVA